MYKFCQWLIISLSLAIQEDYLQSSGVSPHSSSRSLIPMTTLNTIEEQRSPVAPPAASARPLEPSSGDNRLDQGFSGSSLRGRKKPVPAPRRHSSNREDEDGIVSENQAGGGDPRPPPQGWVPEHRNPGANEAGNPLLRQSSQRSQRSWRR